VQEALSSDSRYIVEFLRASRQLASEPRLSFLGNEGRLWTWNSATRWANFLASPLQWGLVYLLPLVWLIVVSGLAGNENVLQALGEPFGLAVLALVWLWALSRCRVMRFVSLQPSLKDVAWIGVPVPLSRLNQIETLCQDATSTNEYADDAMKSLAVERHGAFVSLAGAHHRISEIGAWGIKTTHQGLAVLGWFLAAVVVLPLLALAAIYGLDYLLDHGLLRSLFATPVYMALLVVLVVGWLGAVAFIWATASTALTGLASEKLYSIGYFDRRRQWVPVAAYKSIRVVQEVFARLQKQVSGMSE
jgi:hypothetical protein